MSRHHLPHPRRYSFGSTAAIVTSASLIVGFDAAAASRAALVTGLLIIAVADNVSDSLSIHIYQEAEDLEPRRAWRATMTNFIARLLVAMSFVLLVLVTPAAWEARFAIAWGLCLLVALTTVLARARGVSVGREIAKHVTAAVIVVAASRALSTFIASRVP